MNQANPNPFDFGEAETRCAEALIALALQEDFKERGDITSAATIPAELQGSGFFELREPGVVCGTAVVQLLAERAGLTLHWQSDRIEHDDQSHPRGMDGHRLDARENIGSVRGTMRSLLAFERIALNFLQHLSGVATLTARFVDAVSGTHARIYDTRKTLPGWRALEKYAVRCGGGYNHRLGLFDAVLIKDNHLACLESTGEPIARAIAQARVATPAGTTVEIEVTTLSQFDQALQCAPDIILLDNMSINEMSVAVGRRDAHVPRIELEASGGVTPRTVRSIAETGVDRISIGAITHSAPAIDIALEVKNA